MMVCRSSIFCRSYSSLTLFDMGFFELSVMGGRVHHNFVVIAPMIIKFRTGMKPDVSETLATKNLSSYSYYIIMTS